MATSAPDLSRAIWQKASSSQTQSDSCVEVTVTMTMPST